MAVFGTDGLDTEIEARRVADAHGQAYVSPYNDLAVVAGQGTVGVELHRQLQDIGTVIVAVGGGGLISVRLMVLEEDFDEATEILKADRLA